MADVFDKGKRSEIMSKIRSRNTKAEVLVFSYLRQNKIYFQRHYARVAGTPDIALPRRKRAVFIDGDFWHGRTYEKLVATRPVDDYWRKKISKNMLRDEAQRAELKENGWAVLAIWESDLMRRSKQVREATLETIRLFLISEESQNFTTK